jgi:hypothetical protein
MEFSGGRRKSSEDYIVHVNPDLHCEFRFYPAILFERTVFPSVGTRWKGRGNLWNGQARGKKGLAFPTTICNKTQQILWTIPYACDSI